MRVLLSTICALFMMILVSSTLSPPYDEDGEFFSFSGRFLLDPNEVNGWGALGFNDETISTDLGNVGVANLTRTSGGVMFPYDVKINGFRAWHYNTNSAAQAWGWVLAKQLKNDDSNTVSTTFFVDESFVRAGVNNGSGLRNYLNNRNQETRMDFSEENFIVEEGEVLILGVGAPTAVTTNYYVSVYSGLIDYEILP